jgi:NADH:ubiquinone oxidoreductase subunit F (NADH-binding)
VTLTGEIVAYLAGQSAGRCGPCFNGLPALASAVTSVVDGAGGPARVEQLATLVERRGACAHPDGTVRLVRSMLNTFADEVSLHASSGCSEHRRLHLVPDDAERRAS